MVEMFEMEHTKTSVAKLGIGTVNFGLEYGYTKKKSLAEVESILQAAWDKGIRLLDTARSYGDSEWKIGQVLRGTKLSFVIATKTEKIDPIHFDDRATLYSILNSSVERSLKNLFVQSIDILQLHQTEERLLASEALKTVVLDLKRQGLIKRFGFSVYEPQETKLLLETEDSIAEVIQLPYNIFDQRQTIHKESLIRQGTQVIARSAFLKGILTCPKDEIPSELKELLPYRRKLELLGEEIGLSLFEVALLFVACSGWIDTCIVGVDSKEELIRNCKVLEKKERMLSQIQRCKEFAIENTDWIDPRRWKSL